MLWNVKPSIVCICWPFTAHYPSKVVIDSALRVLHSQGDNECPQCVHLQVIKDHLWSIYPPEPPSEEDLEIENRQQQAAAQEKKKLQVLYAHHACWVTHIRNGHYQSLSSTYVHLQAQQDPVNQCTLQGQSDPMPTSCYR